MGAVRASTQQQQPQQQQQQEDFIVKFAADSSLQGQFASAVEVHMLVR